MKTCVVALDLATTTGWAWHRVGMPRPFFGAMKLPGGPHEVGKPADALERFLRDLFLTLRPEGPPTHYFFEAQHIDGQINIDTVYRLIALGGIVEKFAFQTGAKVYKVHISEWRKHFIGRGAGFKRDGAGRYLPGEDPKELAIQKCAQYGWHTDVADAAEACGILDFSLSLIGDDVHPRPWRDAALLKGRR